MDRLPSPCPTEESPHLKPNKKITSLLSALKKHPSAIWFLEPVDPEKHGCPDYLEKIHNPMDLSTISSKLETGKYILEEEFANDVVLMISNCYLYNPVGHSVRLAAQELAIWFDEKWKQLYQAALDWEGMGVNDLEKQKRQKPLISYEEERPKKRRLGPLRRSNVENDLENLSNTLESMSQQLDLLTKSSLEVNTPLSSDEEIPEPEPEKPKKKKRQINPIPKQDRICEYCGTSETPMWRRGPSGKATLCNKCGVKWRAGRILTNQDGSILPPPSPTTLSKPIKSTKANPRKKNQITYAQKEHVAHVLTLGTLNADQLTHIVTMIRNSMPNLRDSTEEIELDIESLDPKLVGAMYRYVVETVGLKPMQ